MESKIIDCLDNCCELLSFDKSIKTRRADVISVKHAIIYYCYKQFNGFLINIEQIIANYFCIERTTIYNAIKKVEFYLVNNLKYPVVHNYYVLYTNSNLSIDEFLFCKINSDNHGSGIGYVKRFNNTIIVEYSYNKLIVFKSKEKFHEQITYCSI